MDLKQAEPSLESIHVGEEITVTFTVADLGGLSGHRSDVPDIQITPLKPAYEELDEDEEVPTVSYAEGSMPQPVQYDLDDWAKEKTAVQA